MNYFTNADTGKTTNLKSPTSTRRKFPLFKLLSLAAMVLMLGVNGVMGQQVIGTFPAMNGGLEGATIDNSTFSSAQSGKWVRNNNSQTIASETTTFRSGATAISISNGSTGRRVWTPLVTVSSTTSSVTIQYYRRVASTTNAQESQSGVGNGTTSDVTPSSYSAPSSANTWEKVTYNRSSFTFTDIAGAVLSRSIGSGGSIFIDDLVMYTGSVDNAAPNAPGTLTVNNPTTTSLDLSWAAASGGVDGGGYVVVRYASNPNADNDPNQNGIYAVGNTHTNGTGSLIGTVRYIGTGTSFTDNVGLTSSTQYWYKVYTVDKAFNYSAESQGNGTTSSSGTPSIAFSSPTIPTSNLNSSSTNNIIGAVQLDVTTANATLNSVAFTTAGTYTASDIALNGFKFWSSASATDLTGATQLGAAQAAATNGSSISVSGLSHSIATGSPRYIVLSADIASTPTHNATIGITSTAHANVVFASGGKTGTDPVSATATRAIAHATSPTLTAAVSATVDAPFNVTFADDATWRTAITSITVGGVTLTAGYSLSAGQITFTPSASATASLLQSSGSKSIVVIATGYANATVSQSIGFGAATKLSVTTQPTAPASNGAVLATQPIVAIQDQYGNTVTSSSASVTAAKSDAGTWTLGGSTGVAASSGVVTFAGLTASNPAAVSNATLAFTSSGLTASGNSSTFNLPAPAPANDLCASPTNLTVGAAATSGTLTNSTVTNGTLNKNDVWYSFTPSCTGTATITVLFSTGPDIDFEIYPASPCPTSTSGRLLSANSSNATSETNTYAVTQNTTYLIRVLEFTATAGSFTIGITNSVTPQFTLANTGTPVASNRAVGTSNVPLFGFALTPTACTNSFDLTAASITTAGTASSSDLSNFRIIVDANNDGVADAGEISSPIGTVSTLANPLVFSSISGQTGLSILRRYLLIADVANNATPARTFTASLTNANTTASVSVTGSATGNAQTIIASAPTLTAAVGATVDGAFNVTFADDATWRSAITSITIGGVTLTAGSAVTAGQITFTPSSSTPTSLLQSIGSKSIVVIATGYANATVTQSIGVGIANRLAITTQPTAPASNGAALAQQPIVVIRDQYNNLTASTATITATVGAGSWTLGGTTDRAAISGTSTFSGLTATSSASVTGATIAFSSTGLTGATSGTFNIPAPDYISLTDLGATATENFNALTTSSTNISGITGFLYQNSSTPSWSSGSATNFANSNSGSPTTGDNYIWGNTAGDDFSVGVMTSGGYISPNSLMAKYQNNTGSTINNLTVSYDLKRYRINSSAASVQFFYSEDGSTWTAVTDGDISSSTLPTGSSTYSFTPSGTPTSSNQGVVAISNVAIPGLTITNGSNVYLRWNLNTTGGSSQGIGIDNVSLKPCGTLPASTNLSASSTQTVTGSGALVSVSSTTLTTGTYTVTYNVSGTNTVTSTTANMSFTSGSPGTGTFTTSALVSAGASNVVNITALAFTSVTSCTSPVTTSTAAFTTVSTTVTISNTNLAQFTTQDLSRNNNNLQISRFQAVVSNGTASLSSLSFTTPNNGVTNNYIGGTDINNFKLWYDTDNDFTGATQLGSNQTSVNNNPSAGETVNFTSLAQSLAAGTYYFWITADILSSATSGRTLTVNTPTLTLASGSTTGSIAATGTQTIIGVPINYYLNGTNSITAASSYWTLPNGAGSQLGSLSTTDLHLNIGSSVSTTGDFTLSNGSKFILNNGGNLTIASGNAITGTIDVENGGTLTLNSTSIPTLGTLGGTSTIIYGASGAQAVATKNYANLTIDGSGTKTLAATLTANGNLNLNAGTLADGGFTLNVAGNLTGTATHTGAGKINMTGSGATISGASLQNLELNNVGGFSLSGNLTVNGSLTLTAGTFAVGANTLTLAGNYPNSFANLSTTSSSNINFSCTGTNGVTLPILAAINNVTINSANKTYTLGGSQAIGGSLTITSGKLAIGASNTLTLNGGLTCDATNSLISTATSNITLTGVAKTLFFDASNNSLRNLAITGSNTMTLGNALNITGGSSFGVLTVGSGATLATGGFLTLKSDANGTACIGNSAGNVSGSVTVERFVSSVARKYRFISSPIASSSNKTIADWMTKFYVTGPCTVAPSGGLGSINDQGWHTSQANISFPGAYNASTNISAIRYTSIRTYDETVTGSLDLGFTNVTTSTALTPGKGFKAFIRGAIGNTGQLDGSVPGQTAVTLSLTGAVNQGDINSNTTFTSSGTAANDGWNLVGNPYPCGYNIQAQYTAAQTSDFNNVSNTVHIYNGATGGYNSYNANGGATVGVLTGGIIPSGSAFFIQANASTPTFIFKEAYKTSTAPGVLHKTTSATDFAIKYSKDSTESDYLTVKMYDNATLNYDAFDIKKLRNENLNLAAYGTDVQDLAASVIPFVNGETRIKLNVEATLVGTYKFEFTNMDNFDVGVSVSLFDRYTNKTTDVKANTKYTFDMGAGVNQWGKNRFELILNLDKTNVDEFALLNQTQMLVYPNPATDVLNINISNSSFKNSEIVVYNISGTEVLKTNMANNNAQLNIETLSNGVYFVKVSNQNGFNKTVKFVK